jgi:uncharacterized membrane protein YfcA
VIVILLQRNNNEAQPRPGFDWLKYAAGFLSGFLGGLVSMSGPPVVIYMKLRYRKVFFRTQLIAIFFLGTTWRSLLFIWHQIPLNIPLLSLAICFLMLPAGLWAGSHLHIRVNEQLFNKIIALILLLPAISLLLT